jgi:hypothetical protein
VAFNQRIHRYRNKKQKQGEMKFFKKIGCFDQSCDRRLPGRKDFESRFSLFHQSLYYFAILCEPIDKPYAHRFIKGRIIAELYPVKKRRLKEQ